jgi:3-hydroxyacyl-CoA dehydrogenase
MVNENLVSAIAKANQPLYHKDFANRISTGNLDDDLKRSQRPDWIIEVVVERLGYQRSFEKLIKGLITSNTSGIPIHFMNEGHVKISANI